MMGEASASPLGGPPRDKDVPPKPELAGGVLFGDYAAIRDGGTPWGSQLEFEAQIGRVAAVDKSGYAWSDVFPGAYDYWTRAGGRIPIFTWNAQERDGGVKRWADIAAGVYDADIDAKAAAFKAFNSAAYFVFQHEPELFQSQNGTPQDFVDAFQHVHDRFQADGVTNLSYVTQLMSSTYRYGDPDSFYPGDAYVDLLGADGYNWYECPDRDDEWTSFRDIFSDFHDFAVAKLKPMMIAEWGSHEDSAVPGRKAQWITDAAATVKTWPEVKVMSYFNHGKPAATCDWWVDSSTTSLAAFSAMGADPYFNPTTVESTGNVAVFVDVADDAYDHPVGTYAQGMSVQWIFAGPSNYTVTEDQGMGLFDSGSKAPNTSFAYTFASAGNYHYSCTLHTGMKETVRIPLLVSPSKGGLSTKFKVTWGAGTIPTGYVEDVQVKRPGSSTWSTWQNGVRTLSANFTPDSGKGTYSFRARLRKTSNGKASWYSTTVSIVVS
jgi:plastocyanin